MSDSIIGTYKSVIASQKQTLKAQQFTQKKLLEIEAANARIEASIDRMEAKIDEILALLQDQDEPVFADLVRDGEEDVDQLGSYIEAYNQGDRSVPLHEYLGLRAEELVALLENPDNYEAILGLTDSSPAAKAE